MSIRSTCSRGFCFCLYVHDSPRDSTIYSVLVSDVVRVMSVYLLHIYGEASRWGCVLNKLGYSYINVCISSSNIYYN
jgi:hypothetical protein